MTQMTVSLCNQCAVSFWMQIEITGMRPPHGQSGMAIDDIMLRPCVDYGKLDYWGKRNLEIVFLTFLFLLVKYYLVYMSLGEVGRG